MLRFLDKMFDLNHDGECVMEIHFEHEMFEQNLEQDEYDF